MKIEITGPSPLSLTPSAKAFLETFQSGLSFLILSGSGHCAIHILLHGAQWIFNSMISRNVVIGRKRPNTPEPAGAYVQPSTIDFSRLDFQKLNFC